MCSRDGADLAILSVSYIRLKGEGNTRNRKVSERSVAYKSYAVAKADSSAPREVTQAASRRGVELA